MAAKQTQCRCRSQCLEILAPSLHFGMNRHIGAIGFDHLARDGGQILLGQHVHKIEIGRREFDAQGISVQ